MRYILLFVIIGVTAFGLFLANYLGAFKGVDISEGLRGPYKFVYVDHMGPYHKIAPEIAKVEDFMKSIGAPCKLSYGEYIDDPNVIEEARLRAHAGCIVEAFPANLPAEFKTEERVSKPYVIAVFTGSPGIGPMKVYPRADKYISEHNMKIAGPVIEIYEVFSFKEKNAMTTTYLFPTEATK
jgi:hypothetical protein